MVDKAADDLNKVVAAAIKAKISAEVAAAMMGDETLQTLVGAALSREISYRENGREVRGTVLGQAVETAITKQATLVIAEELTALEPKIRKEVKAALAKSVGVIADQLVEGFVEQASGKHPAITISFGR